MNTELDTIEVTQLATVTGGGRVSLARRVYRWWTGQPRAKAAPKEIYGEVRDVAKDVGIGTGAILGGKKAYDAIPERESEPEATVRPVTTEVADGQ